MSADEKFNSLLDHELITGIPFFGEQ